MDLDIYLCLISNETLPFLNLYPIASIRIGFETIDEIPTYRGQANYCDEKEKKLHASIVSFIAWYW